MANELTVLPDFKDFALAQYHPDEIKRLMAENLGNGTISLDDLDFIKMPTGGGKYWDLTGPNGPEPAPSFNGIIIHVAVRRAYWSNPTPTKGELPVCVSFDGEEGRGEPGGSCARCPLNDFGSKVNESGAQMKGKACRETRLVFVLREPKAILPDVLRVAPTSIGALRSYGTHLTKYMTPMTSVWTKFELEQKAGPAGPYSVMKLSNGEKLTSEHLALVRAYADGIIPALSRLQDNAAE